MCQEEKIDTENFILVEKSYIKELEKLKTENAMLVEALEIKEEFLVCYRLGKRPSEKLFDRLEKNKQALAKIKGGV